MAWADAGQRLEAMPPVRTGCNFAVPNRPAVSTPAATPCGRWYQSLAAGGMIYDHVSTRPRRGNMRLPVCESQVLILKELQRADTVAYFRTDVNNPLTLLVKSQICRKQLGHAIVETQKDRDLAPVKRALATVEILLPRLNQ